MAEVVFRTFPKHYLLEEVLVIWHTVEGHYSPVDNVAKFGQYATKRYLADKCHLGDLIAYAILSSAKCRGRICEL